MFLNMKLDYGFRCFFNMFIDFLRFFSRFPQHPRMHHGHGRVYPCGRYLSRRAARVRVLSTRVSEYLPERARVRPWNQPPAMPICVYLITREAAQGTNECVLMAGGLGITIRGRPSSISPKATRVFSWTLRSTARVRVLLSTGICGNFACTSTGTGTGIYGYLASADAPYPRALRMFQYFHDFEYPC